MSVARNSSLAYESVPGVQSPDELPPLRSGDEYLGQLTAASGLPRGAAAALWRGAGGAGFVERLRSDEAFYDRLLRGEDIRWSPFNLLTLNASAVLRGDPRRTDPFRRAASLLVAAAGFRRDLLGGELEQDTFRGAPLEMGQYPNLFHTSLRAGGTASRVRKARPSSYVAVLAAGRPYRLELAVGGKALDESGLAAALEAIADCAGRSAGGAPLGAISCLDQAPRAAIANLARALPGNARALDELAGAMLVLCLDLDASPEGAAEIGFQVHAAAPENRWSLASCQLVVCGNGEAGVVFSYPCSLDGNVMMRFSEELVRRSERAAPGAPVGSPRVEPRRLPLELPAAVADWAGERARAVVGGRPLVRDVEGVGARSLRAGGLSPDALFNLALMTALRRELGFVPRVLEHVTMSRWRNMGLAMAQIATPAAGRFAELSIEGAEREELRRALERAEESHRNALRAARGGLPLRVLTMLLWRGAPLPRRPAAFLAAALTAGRPQAIVSHPAPRAEVALFGRPGVVLPYVGQLALHYQIHPERVQLVLTPGSRARFSPERVLKLAGEELRAIERLAS